MACLGIFSTKFADIVADLLMSWIGVNPMVREAGGQVSFRAWVRRRIGPV